MGRIQLEGMPFTQMILFPTEFKLKTTKDGLRMQAAPIEEIAQLRAKARTWSTLSVADANQKLGSAGAGPLDVKLQASLKRGDGLAVRYDVHDLATIASEDLEGGRGQVEVLIDKAVAEIFVAGESAIYHPRNTPVHRRSRPGVGSEAEGERHQSPGNLRNEVDVAAADISKGS
jgi:fructan beta-fructosidase